MAASINVKRYIQKFFAVFGVNPFAEPYEEIPLATRFFRNKILIKTFFDLLKKSGLNAPALYFHACSTGEEPYSFAIYNRECIGLSISCRASDYNQNALNLARAGWYSNNTIEEVNRNFIDNNFKKYFQKLESGYVVDPVVRSLILGFDFLDYVCMDNDWVLSNRADAVFCNSSLLYHDHATQEIVLEKLCAQAREILVVTGVENSILEKVLKKHGFNPYVVNWEEIYDGCALRRVSVDPVYRTPTTPYLSDANKKKNHYFKYSIFLRIGGAVSNALGIK